MGIPCKKYDRIGRKIKVTYPYSQKEAMGDVLANRFQDVRIAHWSPLGLISVNHIETMPMLCRHPRARSLVSTATVALPGPGP